jgi:hypothetical protein
MPEELPTAAQPRLIEERVMVRYSRKQPRKSESALATK